MERKKVRSNFRVSIKFVLICTIVLGVVLNLVWYFSAFFVQRRFTVFYSLFSWPGCLLPGFVLAVAAVLIRRTAVSVENNTIFITRVWYKQEILAGLGFAVCGAAAFAVVCIYLMCMPKKAAMLPEEITYCGTFISVNQNNFSKSQIAGIRMSSPRKRKDGILPQQYFLRIELIDGDKFRFWLGSRASFAAYSLLCSFMESTVVDCPAKIQYI